LTCNDAISFSTALTNVGFKNKICTSLPINEKNSYRWIIPDFMSNSDAHTFTHSYAILIFVCFQKINVKSSLKAKYNNKKYASHYPSIKTAVT